jgi:hypothetical protein
LQGSLFRLKQQEGSFTLQPLPYSQLD